MLPSTFTVTIMGCHLLSRLPRSFWFHWGTPQGDVVLLDNHHIHPSGALGSKAVVVRGTCNMIAPQHTNTYHLPPPLLGEIAS